MTARLPGCRYADRWAKRRCRCCALLERGEAQCGKCRSRSRWARRRTSRHHGEP
jgi:hypothetical protein